jgi:hypothetical protein
LAYANEHRPWQLYRSVFYQLLGRCREVSGSHGFRFKNKLLSLDGNTAIDCERWVVCRYELNHGRSGHECRG